MRWGGARRSERGLHMAAGTVKSRTPGNALRKRLVASRVILGRARAGELQFLAFRWAGAAVGSSSGRFQAALVD